MGCAYVTAVWVTHPNAVSEQTHLISSMDRGTWKNGVA